jgi:hypothetical protein
MAKAEFESAQEVEAYLEGKARREQKKTSPPRSSATRPSADRDAVVAEANRLLKKTEPAAKQVPPVKLPKIPVGRPLQAPGGRSGLLGRLVLAGVLGAVALEVMAQLTGHNFTFGLGASRTLFQTPGHDQYVPILKTPIDAKSAALAAWVAAGGGTAAGGTQTAAAGGTQYV